MNDIFNKINTRKEDVMKNLFLCRINNFQDRDCCIYIDNFSGKFECDHYFRGLRLHGNCFSGGKLQPYTTIETVLSEEEYAKLVEFEKSINELGYGIKKDDERYQTGLNLWDDIQPVLEKLQSDEAEEFYETIVANEMEVLMEQYGLDEDDIENLKYNYCGNYDRSMISTVYKDTYELGYEEAINCGFVGYPVNEIHQRYFDFEQFGEDLVNEDENYLELDDGRCVVLSY